MNTKDVMPKKYKNKFDIGLFNYQVSISDIVTYYSENGGIKNVNAAIYPQRLSLGLGYRWK